MTALEHLIRKGLDALQDPIVWIDDSFQLLHANAHHALTAEYDPIGAGADQRCFRLWAGRDEACDGCPAPSSLQTGRSQTGRVTDQRGRSWEMTAHPIDDSDDAGSRSLLCCHYKELRSPCPAALIRVDRLAKAGRLARAMAHELNSPLTSIIVLSEAMAVDSEPDSTAREDAEEVRAASRRCREVVQSFQRFIHRQRGIPEAVELLNLVNEIKPLVYHWASVTGIDLQFHLAPDTRAIHGCTSDVEQILVNLLLNSIDACARGASVTVEARNHGMGSVELLVTDTGRGMKAEELQRALQPLGGDSAGLGLAACAEMIAAPGGSLEIDSEQESGTRVRVLLPSTTD